MWGSSNPEWFDLYIERVETAPKEDNYLWGLKELWNANITMSR